jgi:secreted trypsin-like serine protease
LSDNTVDGVKATVIGWGLTEMGSLSAVLKQTDLQIVPHPICKSDPEFQSIVTPRKICAVGLNTIPCKGDSGGGLFIFTKNRWYLRGIVSETLTTPGAKNKCDASKYATYTDVAKFYSWIMNYIQ